MRWNRTHVAGKSRGNDHQLKNLQLQGSFGSRVLRDRFTLLLTASLVLGQRFLEVGNE